VDEVVEHGRTDIRTKVFICHATEDDGWEKQFHDTLKQWIDDGVEVFSDALLEPGTDWRSKIEEALQSATVALLLVSKHFVNSSFIKEKELPSILQRHKDEGLNIHWVPIAEAYCPSLEGLQAACDPQQPLIHLSAPEQTKVIHQICRKVVTDAGQISRLSTRRRDQLTRDVTMIVSQWNIKLRQAIGSGDTAVIYLGEMDGRNVAVKALIDSPIRGRIERATREAELVKQLRHPAFARLIHADIDKEPQCLVLEYISAPTITAHMRGRGVFSVDDVIFLIPRLAEALYEYHTNGMTFGVLSAGDVFYEADRRCLRLPAVSISSRLSIVDSVPRDVRAATYLVPEQYEGELYTAKSDQK
jgi:serine/threonine protein kinase